MCENLKKFSSLKKTECSILLTKERDKEVTVMLNYSMLYPRETVSRRAVSLDGMWKFCLDWESAVLC